MSWLKKMLLFLKIEQWICIDRRDGASDVAEKAGSEQVFLSRGGPEGVATLCYATGTPFITFSCNRNNLGT